MAIWSVNVLKCPIYGRGDLTFSQSKVSKQISSNVLSPLSKFSLYPSNMGFVESLRAQFRAQHGANPDINGPDSLNKEQVSEATEPSVEKRGFNDSIKEPATLLEAGGGIAKVEGAQAVWGKNGRYFIIAG